MLYETPNPHGGEVYARKIDLDFSANINPYGTPQAVKDAVAGSAEALLPRSLLPQTGFSHCGF